MSAFSASLSERPNATDWAAWINLTVPEAELLKPLPSGSLAVETVRPASDCSAAAMRYSLPSGRQSTAEALGNGK